MTLLVKFQVKANFSPCFISLQIKQESSYLTKRDIAPTKVTDYITRISRERLGAKPWKSRAGGQACGQRDGHGGQDHENSCRVRHNQGVGKLALTVKTLCVSTSTAYSQLMRIATVRACSE